MLTVASSCCQSFSRRTSYSSLRCFHHLLNLAATSTVPRTTPSTSRLREETIRVVEFTSQSISPTARPPQGNFARAFFSQTSTREKRQIIAITYTMAAQSEAQAPEQPTPSPPPTTLTLRHPDLLHSLATLRALPSSSLSSLHTLCIIPTDPDLLRWHGHTWPSASAVFDEDDLREYAEIFPPPDPASSSPAPKESFRALLRLVSEGCDLASLDLEVDLGRAAWSLFEDKAAAAYGGDEVDEEWRFVYEFYVDAGRALVEVFRGRAMPRSLVVRTTIWEGMGEWLVGQVTGRSIEVTGGLPPYHNVHMSLLTAGGDGGVNGDSIDELRPL